MRSELTELYYWYEKGGGREFFKAYTNISDFVENYYKSNGTKEVSGVYIIKFNDIPIAIGESRQMGVRFLEHMKVLNDNGEWYWGLNISYVKNGIVDVTIEILEDNILVEADRRKIEEEKINLLQPILQIKYDKYYPNDKIQYKNGVKVARQDIRIDQYILKKLRKERVSEALGFSESPD